MTDFMSSSFVPISIASVASAIISPAPLPTIPAPIILFVEGSEISFVNPFFLPMVVARPEAAQGNFVTSISGLG